MPLNNVLFCTHFLLKSETCLVKFTSFSLCTSTSFSVLDLFVYEVMPRAYYYILFCSSTSVCDFTYIGILSHKSHSYKGNIKVCLNEGFQKHNSKIKELGELNEINRE